MVNRAIFRRPRGHRVVCLGEEKCDDWLYGFYHLAEESYDKERQAWAQLVVSITYLFTLIGVQSIIIIIGGRIYPLHSYFVPPLGVDSSFPMIVLCILVLRSSTFDYRSLVETESLGRLFFSWVVKGVLRGVLFVLAMSTLFPIYATQRVAKYSEIDFMSMLQPGTQACVYNCLLGASTNHSDA